MFRLLPTSKGPQLLWRRGAPVCRRQSKVRRIATFVLLLLFSGTIVAYWYITDADRVRADAERYLRRITGAHVTVESATLSIFEGLRLEKVCLLLDSTPRQDSLLFTAEKFHIRPNLAKLARGQIEASSIIAIAPRVRLVEDVDTGDWNWKRLARVPQPSPEAIGTAQIPQLPVLRLRDARVDYGRLEGGRFTHTGSMAMEAEFVPTNEGKSYEFSIQSRGETDPLGPHMSGTIDFEPLQVQAGMNNLAFGQDMKMMLPEQVRQWWQRHQLAGSINVPKMSYTFVKRGEEDFAAEVYLAGVELQFRPEEAQGADEIWRRAALGEMFALAQASSGDPGRWLRHSQWLIEPQPIQLDRARGTFVFTRNGIEMRDVIGEIEGNAVKITGNVRGYSPDAPFDVQVESLAGANIHLASEPRWINSLPPAARETYDHLRPRGTAAFRVHLERPSYGARVEVNGEIDIIEGEFTFDRFPYPVSRATGRIAFGPSSRDGRDSLELIDLKGYGVPGGPNARSAVFISGTIAPLSPDAGVSIRISGNNISSEEALMRSFPPMTRKALRFLDAPGRGDWPRFTGDFVCRVNRPEGPRKRWTTEVDIDVRDGEGAMVEFPYHLSGVRGKVRVRSNHVEIDNATMQRDGATLVIDGRVDWGDDDDKPRPADEPAIRPLLNITARNAPIDDNLLQALPEAHRTWMQRLGLSGRFDLDGVVKTPPKIVPGEANPTFKFSVKMTDGTLWPTDGTFAVSKISGALELEPEKMVLRDVRGRRNDADIAAGGTIVWPGNKPKLDLTVRATNLSLDGALYQVLPSAGKIGWDAVQPEGTVDATILFKGDVEGGAAPNYRIELQGRQLAVKPAALPCKFTDVTGRVLVTPQGVRLNDVVARRGDARVALSGSGDLAAGIWDLAVRADRVMIDPELTAALPQTLGQMISDAGLEGSYDIVFKKLRVVRDPTISESEQNETDVDFVVSLETRDGSLTAGVPMRELTGSAEFAGNRRKGKIGALTGSIDLEKLMLGTQPVEHLTVTLEKAPDSPVVSLKDLRCILSGGEVAGNINWTWPEDGPSRYSISLVLRDADVRQLVAEAAPQLQGSLTASLAIEGAWDDPASRRGRGDVLVEGREMYRIPLILGLLQITNLSLPINSPFNRGSVRYGVDGDRVTVEAIELSAEQMRMTGQGYLDFANKQVHLNLTTDSTSWLKVPLFDDLLRGARRELLQIRVRGTIEDPKVSAGSMPTITTTIDEVFKGDGR